MMKKTCFFYVFLFIAAFACKCHAEQTINWFHADFPPAFILTGDEKGSGYCDRMEKDVADFLSGYTHVFHESNYKRIVKSLEDGRNVCCASIYKTPEREKFSAYSDPLFIGLSNGVIIPREKIKRYEKYIGPEKTIDLPAVLAQEEHIKIGLISGRNYGDSIESAIASFRKSKKIEERAGNDSQGLIKMLLKERVDMLLALPMEISYAAKQIAKHMNLEKNALVFFPVQDGEQFTTSYMACPGNEWGKAVIEKINVVIAEKRPDFAKYYRDWLDESGAETYEKTVKEVFGFQIPE
ncbi:MAG: TIGR02285 family protein [Desulfococcaceae bacterium]|jgi:uncharacterized protein (TIGR02285 family)|nr:TIGR02285 family protein [Desulfococcaceae bacterium]